MSTVKVTRTAKVLGRELPFQCIDYVCDLCKRTHEQHLGPELVGSSSGRGEHWIASEVNNFPSGWGSLITFDVEGKRKPEVHLCRDCCATAASGP